MDRALESNKINFLSETAVEDIMGDVDNAANYNFSQNCNRSSYNSSNLSGKKKAKWAKLFLAEDQMKINNKDRKLRCNSGDNKSAVILIPFFEIVSISLARAHKSKTTPLPIKDFLPLTIPDGNKLNL